VIAAAALRSDAVHLFVRLFVCRLKRVHKRQFSQKNKQLFTAMVSIDAHLYSVSYKLSLNFIRQFYVAAAAAGEMLFSVTLYCDVRMFVTTFVSVQQHGGTVRPTATVIDPLSLDRRHL